MAKTLHDFYETLMPIKKVFFIWVEFLKRVFRAEISIWKRPAKQNCRAAGEINNLEN